jgi:hypothetical protein
MKLSSSGDAYFPVDSEYMNKLKNAKTINYAHQYDDVDSPVVQRLSAPSRPAKRILNELIGMFWLFIVR